MIFLCLSLTALQPFYVYSRNHNLCFLNDLKLMIALIILVYIYM